jgi:hypothetical protein
LDALVELSDEDKIKKALYFLRRQVQDAKAVEDALIALARAPYEGMEELAKSWFDGLPKKLKPKEDFAAIWQRAEAKPVEDGDPTVEKLLTETAEAEAREAAEIDRCARLSEEDYGLERRQVAAKLHFGNVTDLNKAVNARKREIKKEKKAEGATQTDTLAKLASSNIELLFHTPDGKPYADIAVTGVSAAAGRKTLPIRARAFKSWLEGLLKRLTGRSYEEKVIKAVVNDLRVTAEQDDKEHKVYKRAANVSGVTWLDIGDANYRAIKISKAGWQIVDMADVRFIRTNEMVALPSPIPSF